MTTDHDTEPESQPSAGLPRLPEFRSWPARPRRRWLPLMLFGLSCLSVCFAGICRWYPPELFASLDPRNSGVPGATGDSLMQFRLAVLRYGGDAVIYTVCLLAILLTHEMGHFLMSLRYGIPASFPYFLPLPISPIGTLGAVIAMDGRRANRREIFDIGLAGPIAGLVVAVPILWYGITQLDLTRPPGGPFAIDLPLVVRWLLAARNSSGAPVVEGVFNSQLNPYFMAGWVGLLVTGLNMLPVSQLDGGHVIHGLFGRRARWIARGFVVLAIAYIAYTGNYSWVVMLVLIMLMGPDHPPTRDDAARLGFFRFALGLVSLLIPLLCFPPRVFRDV